MRPVSPALPRALACLALAAVLGLAAGRARAEDDAGDPAAAFDAARKTVPTPTGKTRIEFRGVLHIDGKNLGHARLYAQPLAHASAPRWIAGEQFVFKGRAVPRRQRSWATFASDLTPLAGGAEADGEPRIRWTRDAKGFSIRWTPAGTADADAAPENTKQIEHTGTALNTMAATVLFCRTVIDKPGTYSTHIFEPEDAVTGAKALQPVAIEVLGEQTLQGRKVLAARAAKEDKTLTMLFAPDTKALVALRLEQGASKVEILPGDMWVMPARDAVTAGMRAMFGFSARQLRVLDDVIDWPRVHKRALARMTPAQQKERGDVETFRRQLLGAWQKKLQERSAPMMQQIIASQKDAIQQETLATGDVHLTFPPMLRGSQFVVGETDGIWQVIDLPPPPPNPAPKPVPKQDEPNKDEPKEDDPDDGK